MARGSFSVDVEGLQPLLRELTRLGPEVNKEARDASVDIADELARNIRRRTPNRQAEAIQHSVRARRDRAPKVVAGGQIRAAVSRPIHGRKKGSRSVQDRPTSGQLVQGVEFGARQPSWRFPHRGYNADGYWVGPVFRRMMPEMVNSWIEALDRVLARGDRDG